MSTIRDYLMKKYEGALKTIWEQTAHIKQLEADLAARIATVDQLRQARYDNDGALAKRVQELSVGAHVEVYLDVNGSTVPLTVVRIHSSNGRTRVNVREVDGQPTHVLSTGAISMKGALDEALTGLNLAKDIQTAQQRNNNGGTPRWALAQHLDNSEEADDCVPGCYPGTLEPRSGPYVY